MIRYDITFTGHVQGVWFRATAQEIAARFPITGWVRNESDGSVRCVAEGDAAVLDQFVQAVQDAKRGNIRDTRISRQDATDEFAGFFIQY